jgi:FkbM family methyltransferase
MQENGESNGDRHYMASSRVVFRYEGQTVEFASVSEDDHILGVMRKLETFYERDVLECIRQILARGAASGAAIDAGAFIGTHAIYFALFCPLRPVISFEANSATFPTLLSNVRRNGLEGIVIPINRALGSRPGQAEVLSGPADNQGASSVRYLAEGSTGNVPACTLDDEVNQRKLAPVAVIKIDVEGAELEVLRGGTKTILVDLPLLCIEVHTVRRLISMLSILRHGRYWILDCLGYSPTYVVAASRASLWRRVGVNSLWVIRALVPATFSTLRWYLKRLAQVLSVSPL